MAAPTGCCLPFIGRRRFRASKQYGSPTSAQVRIEENYEYISIAAVSSLYETPRSSATFISGQFHPYSALCGYSNYCKAQSGRFDYHRDDTREIEMRMWVESKYRNDASLFPSLADFPLSFQNRYNSICLLCNEREQFIQAMAELELLRIDLSGCTFIDNPRECMHALDFLVIDKVIQRLRWKYIRLRAVTDACQPFLVDGVKGLMGWSYNECGDNIKQWTQEEDDGSFSVVSKTLLNQPLFNVISLLYEVDLHPSYMPHLGSARKVHQVTGCGTRSQMLAHHRYSLPMPLYDRDLVVYAFGSDCVDVVGIEGVVIAVQSIPQGASEWWGHPTPLEDNRTVREYARTLSYVLRPVDGGGHTEVLIVANLDKNIAFIPKRLINWLIKDMLKGMTRNMNRLGKNFNQTEFHKRISLNAMFYDFIRDSIVSRVK